MYYCINGIYEKNIIEVGLYEVAWLYVWTCIYSALIW